MCLVDARVVRLGKVRIAIRNVAFPLSRLGSVDALQCLVYDCPSGLVVMKVVVVVFLNRVFKQ